MKQKVQKDVGVRHLFHKFWNPLRKVFFGKEKWKVKNAVKSKDFFRYLAMLK